MLERVIIPEEVINMWNRAHRSIGLRKQVFFSDHRAGTFRVVEEPAGLLFEDETDFCIYALIDPRV